MVCPIPWGDDNQQSTVRNAHMCAYHSAQMLYTRQHRAVLVIFCLILRKIITAQMLSTGGKGCGLEI